MIRATHGSEYYQALLAQPEDDIVKPKRASSTQKSITDMRKHWRRFCQEILQKRSGPSTDSTDCLRKACLRDIQVFLQWLLHQSRQRKVKTLLNCVKTWSTMYRDDIGVCSDKDLIAKINIYCRTTLTQEFALDPTVTPKESTNERDLYHLLAYLWAQDKHIYPVERQRLQTALLTQLIALTTVRPGSLVESSCYRNSNEALRYQDVVLRLVRDPLDQSQSILLMEVTVRLWKGARERMKPVTFVFYEHDCLLFCPVLNMLGLAFADNAFECDVIQGIQDIYEHKIPDFKESTQLKWKDDWLPRPIFRRACSTTSETTTSLIKPLRYESLASQIGALGKGAGFRAPLTAYAFRRGAAQVVNSIATPAERNQIMGHTNSYIFEKYYQNRVVSTDISAAFLKKPPRSSLLASVGHIGIDRDPRAPCGLEPEEKSAALADQRYVAIEARIKELRSECYRACSGPLSNSAVVQSQKKELTKVQNQRQRLRQALLKSASRNKRKKFFDNIDQDDIRQAKSGIKVTYNPPLSVYSLPCRANLATILTHVDPHEPKANQLERRFEALQNLIDLCHSCEPHHMNPASTASHNATGHLSDVSLEAPKDATDKDKEGLQNAIESMELVPLALPSTICIFCVGNEKLANSARTASFSRIDSLRRHVETLHLAKHIDGETILCPHPSCDAQFQIIGEFKNHAATIHNVWLSQ
ncbi:hypothetical protein ACLMJK_009510 [Lecanora helva]